MQRTVEAMVVLEMKSPILSASSPYQIGGQEGNRSQQHLFTVRSIMARYQQLGRMLWLNVYDISAFFDKESLRDVMSTLYEAEVNQKAYRTFFLLNKNTSIQVKTGSGLSEKAEVKEIICQGSGGAALVSQLNLDKGVDEMFRGSRDEINYGTVRIQPLIFQDDVLRLADCLSSVKAGNMKIGNIMNQKKLKLNEDKTGFIMMGNEIEKKRTRVIIERSPIVCGNFRVGEKFQDKYLGDVFHQGCFAASVLATIMDREGKIKAAMLEAAAIVDDYRSQCIGGFMVAIDLLELAILPSLITIVAHGRTCPRRRRKGWKSCSFTM